MWCIGALTEEYRERMYDLLDLYARSVPGEGPRRLSRREEQTTAPGYARALAGPSPVRRQNTITNMPEPAPAPVRSGRTKGWPAYRHDHRPPGQDGLRFLCPALARTRFMPEQTPHPTWLWTTSTPISASASRKCWVLTVSNFRRNLAAMELLGSKQRQEGCGLGF